jgi:hypothetical protein
MVRQTTSGYLDIFYTESGADVLLSIAGIAENYN